MGKIDQVLRSEISRLAGKEIRSAIVPLASQIRKVRRENGELKTRVAELERTLKKQSRMVAPAERVSAAPPEEGVKARLSPGLLKKLRNRLGISQTELATLVNVSQPAVASWEQGRAKPRPDARAAIVGLRDMTKAKIRELLASQRAK